MRYKLICCDVFMRMACLAIANTSNIIDPEFTELGAHENSSRLREILQKKIDDADKTGLYDAILLGYGLCGNSTAGLKARNTPLVIPRAHDCCTIFLGSKEKFLEYFKDNLSAQWSSIGYMERSSDYLRNTDTGKLLGLDKDYEELVEKYGEENAKYIWETLHPEYNNDEFIYIYIPEFEKLRYPEKAKSVAAKDNKTFKLLKGDMRIINDLINGKWNENDFLIVPPGKEIKAVYDNDRVISI
ncbi:MAG TPA: DUF1638 domain-containing protein [Clostridiaceae bacterium]|nr:DUF1638 domain-containing protein [Clostridiaceae bacterium]